MLLCWSTPSSSLPAPWVVVSHEGGACRMNEGLQVQSSPPFPEDGHPVPCPTLEPNVLVSGEVPLRCPRPRCKREMDILVVSGGVCWKHRKQEKQNPEMGLLLPHAAAEMTSTVWQTGTCCWIQRHNNKITSLPHRAGRSVVLLATSPRPWRTTRRQPDTPVGKTSFCAHSPYFAPDHTVP